MARRCTWWMRLEGTKGRSMLPIAVDAPSCPREDMAAEAAPLVVLWLTRVSPRQRFGGKEE